MGKSLVALMSGLLVTACSPAVTQPPPPPHDGPRFEVTSASRSLGSVSFEIDAAQRLVGRVELSAEVDSMHPLRLAVRWSKFPGDAEGEVEVLPLLFDGRRAEQTFDVPVAAPPASARFVQPERCLSGSAERSAGQLILFVDVNENGVLDGFDAAPIDRVLGASTFPTELLGVDPPVVSRVIAYRRECGGSEWFSSVGEPATSTSPAVKFGLFDDPRLDLVACHDAQRFAAEAPCGITRVTRPVVTFSAQTTGDEGMLSFYNFAQFQGLEVFVDDQPKGPIVGNQVFTVLSKDLLVGEHRVRVEGPGLLPWEATLTFPQPIVVLARPRVLEVGKSYAFAWSAQGGVTSYHLAFDAGATRDAITTGATSVEYEQAARADRQTHINFALNALFGDLPLRAVRQFEIPVDGPVVAR